MEHLVLLRLESLFEHLHSNIALILLFKILAKSDNNCAIDLVHWIVANGVGKFRGLAKRELKLCRSTQEKVSIPWAGDK